MKMGLRILDLAVTLDATLQLVLCCAIIDCFQ